MCCFGIVPVASVAEMLADGVRAHATTRLTRRAELEFGQLESILSRVTLTEGEEDERASSIDDCHSLRAGPIYRTVVAATVEEPSLSFRRLAEACKEDAKLWSCRFKIEDKHVATAWCNAVDRMQKT